MFAILAALLPASSLGAAIPSAKEHTNTLGMKFIHIKPGEFLMGQGAEPPHSREEWLNRDWDEAPDHKVTISKGFYMAACETTNLQYEQFDPKHKKYRRKPDDGRADVDTDNEPVTFITWHEARDFCAWLSNNEGKSYRLPTEAEWEYCCRAGTRSLYSTGDTIQPDQANFGVTAEGKRLTTVPVGTYKPNPWLLHDMHGNVAEWCLDIYGPYESGQQTDPLGRESGDVRVVRGWSFQSTKPIDNKRFLRCANRSGQLPDDANRYTGFRVVIGEMPSSKLLPAIVQPYQRDVRQVPLRKAGLDPAKPFFKSYSKEGAGPLMANDSWGPIFNKWNHFSAICVCPNDDLLAVWYTTVNESGRECSQAVSRLRAGAEKWDPVCSFFTIPDVNCHAPVLFTAGKRIYHFFTQSLNGWDDASNGMRFSDDSGATWSPARIILPRTDADALSQPCSCIKTKDGTLVLACDGDNHKDERFLISKDDGKTWRVAKGDIRKSSGRKYVIHPALFQREDGAILTYMRGQNPMPVAISKDLGETFEVAPTGFPGIGSGQKAAVLKLQSGAVLLCSMDRTKELVGGVTFAALSLDDGKTWPHIKKVEGTGGYMSLAQFQDGLIYLNGTQMQIVAFNEAWIKEK